MSATAGMLLGTVAQAGTEGERHINPLLTGAGTFVLFCVLLIITLQFDKNR